MITKLFKPLHSIYVLLALIPWIIILVTSSRGFDITDESFYLLNFINLEDVSAAFSLFGVIGKPLYDLSGGNIVILRVLNILIWLVISSLVTYQTIKFLFIRLTPSEQKYQIQLLPLILIPISGGTLYYTLWLITPSYNFFTLVGITAFWGGVLLWQDIDVSRKSVIGSFIIGLSAGIIFWAKITSSMLLPLFPLMILILNRNKWRQLCALRTIVIGAIGLTISLSLPLLNGFGPQEIVEIFLDGVTYMRTITTGYSDSTLGALILGVRKTADLFVLNPYQSDLIRFVTLPLLVLILLTLFTKQKLKQSHNAQVGLQLAVTVGWLFNILFVSIKFSEQLGNWGLNIVLITLVFLLVGSYLNGLIHNTQHGYQWLWFIPVFSCVVVFVFGTHSVYGVQATFAGYFFLLTISILLLTLGNNVITFRIVQIAPPILLLIVVYFISFHSTNPYRQDTSIWQMDEPIYLESEHNILIVSNEMSRYVREFQTLAIEANFQPRTPMIDLTGQSPGVAYILQAEALGFPWLIGGHKESDEAAVYLLNTLDDSELQWAWILTSEEKGERPISKSVLNQVGLDFPDNYELVGTVRRPDSKEIQGLWRPSILEN